MKRPDPKAAALSIARGVGASLHKPLPPEEHEKNLSRFMEGVHPLVPRVLHTGTTGDFSAFDMRRANIESNLGAGIYASNSKEDVAANYAGEGPDLTNRIERKMDEFRDSDEEGYTENELRNLARESLNVHHKGLTMPIHMALKNPAVLGGQHETVYDFEQSYDEEKGEYGEPSGKAVDLAEAFRRAASEFDLDQNSIEETAGKLFEHAMDYGGIKASEAERLIKDGAMYAADPDTGDAAGSEVFRRTLEHMGHDGIIDTTVNRKFGTGARGFGNARVPGMSGVNPDTIHYVAFKPTQIKSALGNQGTFDPNDPYITKAEGGEVGDTLLDSTGKPVHHTLEGVEAFKRWHEGSKAVDEQGRPLVVYHGSIRHADTDTVKGMGDIHAFDRLFSTKFRAPSVDTMGSWFSTNPGEGGAEMYSGSGAGSVIYPAYLSIKNPHETTFEMMERRARLLANGKDDGRKLGEPEVNAYRQWLSDIGVDGVKIVHDEGNRRGSTEFKNQDAWIALEPGQIKSATGNDGTFDHPTDITKAEGGQVEGTLLDSTGKPVHHTPEGVEAFKRWHEGSKAVDEQGRPLVVYHGMTGPMEGDAFRASSWGTLGEGIYFTHDPDAAGKFATGVRGSETEPKTQGQILPVYLQMKQPFDDDFFVGNKPWQEWAASLLRDGWDASSWKNYSRWVIDSPHEKEGYSKLHDKLMDGQATLNDLLFTEHEGESPFGQKVLEHIKKHGDFDGVILKSSPKGFGEYLVFNPEQIKSATGNDGTWDHPTDITKAEGGEVAAPEPVTPENVMTPPARKFNAIGLYSHAAEQARALPQQKGPLNQMLSTLRNRGVKQDEIAHSGVIEKFANQPFVTRDELADHFDSRVPSIQPKTDTKNFQNWSLKGGNGQLAGKNYREHLLMYGDQESGDNFTASHWPNVPNILSHLRTQDFLPKQRKASIPWEHPELNTTATISVNHATGLEKTEVPAAEVGIPGLLVHKAKGGKDWEYTLTHANSGLSLVNTVPYHAIRQFADQIRPQNIDWTQPAGQLKSIVPAEVKKLARDVTNGWEMMYPAPKAKPVRSRKKRDSALLLDEVQSDWGQKARDLGIKGIGSNFDEQRKEYEDLFSKREEANSLYQFLSSDYSRLFKMKYDSPDEYDHQATEKASNRKELALKTWSILNDATSRAENNLTSKRVPQGPYIDSTEKWSDLSLKYALKKAVDEGRTHLVWTPSDVQTARYGAATQELVDSFNVTHHPETGTFVVTPQKNDNNVFVPNLYESYLFPKEVKEVLGKDLADLVTRNAPENRIGEDESGTHQYYKYTLDGPISVGKSGQEFMYDKLIPKRLIALARQHDPEAKLTTYQGEHEAILGFPALEITPRMAESIKENGFKAFKRGGEVEGVDHALRVARQARKRS